VRYIASMMEIAHPTKVPDDSIYWSTSLERATG
jgi:hypothetical protein